MAESTNLMHCGCPCTCKTPAAAENAAQSESHESPLQSVDQSVMQLVEEQKRKKKKFLQKIEKQYDAMQKLELEQQLKVHLEVPKRMEDPEAESQKKTDEMKDLLADKEEHIDYLDSIIGALIDKERKANDELQAAKQELINGLSGMLTGRTTIRLKRMGEIDIKPFQAACKRKFDGKRDIKASEICSSWQHNYFTDSGWHPFKIVKVEGKIDEYQSIIDQDDERLKNLKDEWGMDVYQAVTKAFMELNEYDPSGRECCSEFWHNEEDRKANLKEVVEQVMKKWVKKRKRT